MADRAARVLRLPQQESRGWCRKVSDKRELLEPSGQFPFNEIVPKLDVRDVVLRVEMSFSRYGAV